MKAVDDFMTNSNIDTFVVSWETEMVQNATVFSKGV